MNMKKKMVRKIRYVLQAFGILFTIIGLFTGYPIAKAFLLGITFIMGPIFCGWICPFGTLQDFFGMLGDKLGIKKRTVPKSLNKVLVYLRYVLLLITTFISIDFIFSLLSLDPRSNLSVVITGNSLTVIGWIVIGIFLGISLFFKRPFCNYLCIEGAKYGLVSALRPVTIIRDENSCINCNKCNRVCPMNIDVSSYGQVRSLQCVNCMECVLECPVSNTLTVSIVPVRGKNRKIVLPIIIISALSAFAFIVYNNINYGSLNIGMLSGAFTEKSTVVTGESTEEYGDVAGIADGVYTGTGTGYRGEMSVEVTVKDKKITKIEVTETVDDAKWFDRAYSTIASEIISSQTANVDNVSGATYSSMGIKEAVANALINAGGKNVESIVNDVSETDKSTVSTGESTEEYGDAAGIADGVYTGTGTGYRGEMSAEVTVKDEKITKIEVTETVDDAKWFDRAYSTVVSEIISSQTADVDTVSGATYSSTGIKEAVANALINAGGKNVDAIVNDLPKGGHSNGKRTEGEHFDRH